ncbi:protein of unknown function [Paenibacillus tianmuensis]|uniref:DUF4253 domain-containing protein n=1 Tax=Paenibacillus tianmuensis TaxID=624147 RepID=A0A1G4T3A5_9BACL|nr:DUF4253 domain-containing protein [Paenibacillus tianmuensis]SCW75295.1 protein of unknown function [Paenibacillus tianmuensis]
MTDDCKAILDFLNCDYELFENEKNGEKIVERFNKLTAQGKTDGFYPLIIVVSDILVEALEPVFDDYDVENTAEGIAAFRQMVTLESEKINAEDFLSERISEYMEMHKDMDVLGQFKPEEPNNCFWSFMNDDKPHEEIIIAKIPTKNPWELAAWIPMGGFNDCPAPAEQMAVFRYWYEKYGAVPAVVTYDNWEMQLTNPPLTLEASESLAKEHFAFCYDIVMQGSDNIRALASSLKDSTTWYFWWD